MLRSTSSVLALAGSNAFRCSGHGPRAVRDEDYTALAKTYPTPPATAGIVFDDDWGRLPEQAFLHDFAGDLLPEEARVLYAVQQPFKKSLTTEKTSTISVLTNLTTISCTQRLS